MLLDFKIIENNGIWLDNYFLQLFCNGLYGENSLTGVSGLLLYPLLVGYFSHQSQSLVLICLDFALHYLAVWRHLQRPSLRNLFYMDTNLTGRICVSRFFKVCILSVFCSFASSSNLTGRIYVCIKMECFVSYTAYFWNWTGDCTM